MALPEFHTDPAIGFGTQLAVLQAKRHVDQQGDYHSVPFVEYPGDGSTPTYRAVFRTIDTTSQDAPMGRAKKTAAFTVYETPPLGGIPHALGFNTPFGLPIIHMSLQIDTNDLVGVIRDPITDIDIRVVNYGIDEATGEYAWKELHYQVDESTNPHVARLVGGTKTLQHTRVHVVETGRVQFADDPQVDFSGIHSIGQGDPQPISVETLLAEGEVTAMNWVETAYMYLTQEMPNGDDLTAQQIAQTPLVLP